MARTSNVVELSNRRPKSFTSAEKMLDEVRQLIFKDGRPYRLIAEGVGVGHSTIANIASGKTRWPRHTTLFPLMVVLGYKIQLVKG